VCFNQTTCDICEENYGFLGDDCVMCPDNYNLTDGVCIGNVFFLFWDEMREVWEEEALPLGLQNILCLYHLRQFLLRNSSKQIFLGTKNFFFFLKIS